MNRSMLLFSAVCLSGVAFAGLPTYKPVPFTFNAGQVVLTEAQKNAVDSIYSHLAAGDNVYLTLLNPDEENLKETEKSALTYKRAEAIINFCRNKKIPSNEYFAEIVPGNMPNKIRTGDLALSSNRNYMLNSRTAIVFCPKEKVATTNASINFNAVKPAEIQTFTVDAKAPVDLTLKSGTKIEIAAGDLVLPNGKAPVEPVNIAVSEYKDVDAMIMHMMTTTCHGKNLQSGGMWNISATSGGQPLVMKAGKKYHIKVANDSPVKNMQVFTGEMKNGMLDWKLQNDDKVTAGSAMMGGNVNAAETRGAYWNPANELNSDSPNIAVVNGAIPAYNNTQVNNNFSNRSRNINKKNKRYYPNSKINISEDFTSTREWTKEEKEQIEAAQTRMQNIYDLELNDMGWINCDAFYEVERLANVVVTGEVDMKTTAMLVYPGRKSVLPGYFCTDGNSAKFDNIAADEQAMLVVFVQTGKGDEIKKFTKMIVPGKQKNVVVNMEKGSMASLQAEIKGKLSDI
ncbi:MAG TPA: hypothetical protein VD905_13880 [Flavobacteriales bacterium]|nr:hypothetical protein [Flavobacteriales bacterium]